MQATSMTPERPRHPDAGGLATTRCSIAFDGAWFGWPYYAGVAAYLQAHAAEHPIERVYGTSSGAVIAAMLVCGIDAGSTGLDLWLRADRLGRGDRRHPFLRPRAFLQPHVDELARALPREAHRQVSGRLFIRLRRVRTWRQFTVSEFPTQEALIDALVGAVAVPGLTVPLVHWSPTFGAVIDGGPGVTDDDRAGVATLRVGVRPGCGYHIAPARPLGWRSRFSIQPDAQRRQLFELGRGDAARYFAGRQSA